MDHQLSKLDKLADSRSTFRTVENAYLTYTLAFALAPEQVLSKRGHLHSLLYMVVSPLDHSRYLRGHSNKELVELHLPLHLAL